MFETENHDMMDLVDKINFAGHKEIKELYIYALRDRLMQQNEAIDVGRKYHEGKFDPQKIRNADPRNLKRKPHKAKVRL